MPDAKAAPKFSGTPIYESDEARALVEDMIAAHGGMSAWDGVETLQFHFFTKVVNPNASPPPFYSIETTRLSDGAAHIEWPLINAQTVWDGKTLWSENWNVGPLPAGFFIQLTTSFITLPWLTQTDGVTISAIEEKSWPGSDVTFPTVRMILNRRAPMIPGEFYDLFIDPETKRLKAIGFNITHPGMVRIAGQSIGPNYHVFKEYTRVGNAVLGSYYETIGSPAANGLTTRAIHNAFRFRQNIALTDDKLKPGPNAIVDEESMNWWKGEDR
jgi:hypothetical protein